jgi:hypothetical protein
MNAHQMVCHLADCFRAVMGRKTVSNAPRFFAQPLLKWVALYSPAPWPHGVSTRPEIDQLKNGTPPGDFQSDLDVTLSLTQEFASQPRSFEFTPHPFFLEMTYSEWMRWGYLHTDHHLRQFGL